MKNKWIWLFIGSFLICLPQGFTQKSKLRKAGYLMEALRYDEARNVYSKILKKDENNAQAIIGMADALRKSNNWEEAEAWYGKVVALTEVQPAHFFNYGQILLYNENCEAAQQAFNSFLVLKPDDGRKPALQDVCAFKENLFEIGARRIKVNLPDFNGTGSDIGPAFYGEGIVFGSVRQQPKQQEAFYDLYYTEPVAFHEDNGVITAFDSIRGFSSILNSNFNDAIITFSPDKSEVYFTRNQTQAKDEKFPIRRLEILISQKDSLGRWGDPESLMFNAPEYSSAHPALSPDGQRLFFSSDRPGGFGGKDIYVCHRIGTIWSAPINLGAAINTEGDELFPFYHPSGELYFASDGHLGLGGKDVFRIEDLGEGDWSAVENLGAPLNSGADDFGLILSDDATYGYFTSNRTGGFGKDDIYAFQPRQVLLNIQFTDTDSIALSNKVKYTDISGESRLKIAENGKLRAWVPYNDCLRIKVADEDFRPEEIEICATSAGLSDTLNLSWILPRRNEPATVHSTKTQLLDTPEENTTHLNGWVNDALTGGPIPGAKLILQSTECNVSYEVVSDERGRFNIPWEPDCCYELLIMKGTYFTKSWDAPLCAMGNRNQQEVVVNLSPYRLSSNQSLNQPSSDSNNSSTFKVGLQTYEDERAAIPYLLNIYYDLGRASVRAEAIPELNKLHDLFVDNPDIKIEISSHTDSQGGTNLNQRLSQRRADAIVRWLVSKGISRSRIIGIGYGENRLVNNCGDGVDCSDDEHQDNRRTEFRVVDF